MVACVVFSSRKFRSSRGPNCEEVIESVTTVTEKTTPATVNIAPARAVRVLRAVLPVDFTQSGVHSEACRSTSGATIARIIAARISRVGTNQNPVRKESHLLMSQVCIGGPT